MSVLTSLAVVIILQYIHVINLTLYTLNAAHYIQLDHSKAGKEENGEEALEWNNVLK